MTFRRLTVLHLAALLLSGIAGLSAQAWADDPPTIQLTIKDHRFSPAEIHVPSGKPVMLRVTNADDTVEEFDSSALQVEKVIVAGHSATVRLHPLAPGRFPFIGEYHAETAKGVVIADP